MERAVSCDLYMTQENCTQGKRPLGRPRQQQQNKIKRVLRLKVSAVV